MNLPAAYEGKEPYIFISYAHRNSDRVIPMISWLQRRNFRVWYDAGIEAGTEWPEYIAEHMARCGCFVAFITKDALASQNCRREINFAISRNLPMLAVYLEEVTLTPGMEMQLGTLQALYSYRHVNELSFLEALCQAAILQKCRVSVETAEKEEMPVKPVADGFDSQESGIVADSASRKVDLSAAELDLQFVEAVEIILKAGSASISLLQRKMTIGFGRASRIIDQMEQCGIIGPNRGPKPREVLINEEQWEKIKIEWDL